MSGSGRRLGRALLWVSSAALVTSSARWVRAQTGDVAPPADTRGFVDLAVAGSDDDVAALVEALRELVGRLGLGLRGVRAEAPPWSSNGLSVPRDERARVFVDNRLADRIEITASVVTDGTASAPVVRRVPRAESTAIVVEQVAHAVHATLESLLSGGVPPPEPSRPAPVVEPPIVAVEPAPPHDEAPPATPARRRSGFGMDATAFASGRGMASSTGPVIGGGGAVNLTAWRGQWRPSLWLGGSYNATFAASEEPAVVTLATSVTSLRAVPNVELLDLSLLQVDLGVGAGVDVFHAVPENAGANATLKASTTLADPLLCAQLVARIRFISSARIVIGLDVDYDVHPHHYIDSNSTAVLEPWPVRPSAMVGLCVPLVGTVACAGPE
ncbi:MAG: hypothetical protein ACLP1X_25505 [Polyangiaceae bacterium]